MTKIEGFARRHVSAGITRGSSVSVVDNLGTCRPAARDRTLLFPSNLQVGNLNLIIDHNTMETTIRETLRRPGPHPHRSIRTSFDPHVIFMHHIDSNWIGQLQWTISWLMKISWRSRERVLGGMDW